MSHKNSKGISIVEIIVASAIVGISVVGIVGAIQVYLKIVIKNARDTQAALLLDETAEALQYMRDDSFSAHYGSVANGTQYTVFWNGTGYEMGTSTVTLEYGMTRKVVFSDVERDGNDRIAVSGSNDDNTKKAVITISWPYDGTDQTVSAETLIHNIYEN